MVKKKAPFIPVTIIVIGVGLVIAFNARNHPVDPEEAQKQMQEQASQLDHPKADPDAISQSIKNATQSVKPAPKVNGGPQAAGPGGPDQNPMLANKPEKFKPTYNPTTAEAGWYRPK